MKVIGFVGDIGSGKDSAAEYICQKYGYRNISMGDIVRELLKKSGKPENRENLDSLQKEIVAKHGPEFFAKEVMKKIMLNKLEKVIISGIRRPADAEVPKRAYGKDFVLVKIEVPAEIRFERMKSRARPGDPKTLEEFLEQEKRQYELFSLKKIYGYVDHRVDNSGTPEELEKRLDALLKKIGFA
jgi:dephospho-CoA kinase